jgi:uncharacterized protein YdiU (UPF0061 family)
MSKREVKKEILMGLNAPHARRSRAINYDSFANLDGSHPWQTAVPDGYVAYQARTLPNGNLLYFNYVLAKEMGLISETHPHEMTDELKRITLETFCLQIINEYDMKSGRKFPAHTVKPKTSMATRYLQLQHSNKQGKTSGDGRGIWNGVVRNNGQTWDVSSRGTGVTKLAPGSVEADRPLKTGAGEYGYGCGLADVDELYGSALMSEIFYLQGIPTERVLAVIDLGQGMGIGVRAAENLLRPAHLFSYLKQNRLEPLRHATECFIQRQLQNRIWKFKAGGENRYDQMLSHLANDFAKFAALLERNYIFAWLDWDGDNVLANAGIIDYGSIRQFGLRHDQYRYDDVQRFSTNLNEQKGKARLMLQVFIQLADFLKTGRRKTVNRFSRHPVLKEFDQIFNRECRLVFLQQIGFDETQSETLLQTQTSLVEKLYRAFSDLERTKTKVKMKRVPDGVNRPAVFNMRAVLRELPALLKDQYVAELTKPLAAEEFISLMSSSFAKKQDLKLSPALRSRIDLFQNLYVRVLQKAQGGTVSLEFFENLIARAGFANKEGRITGNATEHIIAEVLKARKKGLSAQDVQNAVELFISHQVPQRQERARQIKPVSLKSPVGQLLQSLVQIAVDFQEDI